MDTNLRPGPQRARVFLTHERERERAQTSSLPIIKYFIYQYIQQLVGKNLKQKEDNNW